jgi:DNA-binding PadR family transcriptional regulator
MKNLTERMDLAKTVLHELSRQPLYRTELEQRTTRKAGTHATFEGIFHYLVEGGYIKKSEQKHRAKYIITEKGTKLLGAIQ